MKINYIILAHKNSHQLKRLVTTLNEKWVSFYIHLDINVDIKPFQKALKDIPNTYFLNKIERKNGTWGDIGIVEATINALKKILADNSEGYCILLSGQDYPLRSNENIQHFLSKNRNHNFITAFPLPNLHLDQGGMPRITRYKINKSGKRGHFLFLPSIFEAEFYNKETLGKLNFLRKSGKWQDIFQVVKKRKFPKDLKPYAGGQWWALNILTIKKILKFIENHPEYLEYHRYSLLPDEMFFQSIIIYLENSNLSEISNSLTYVNWERPLGPLPVTFNKVDFEELREASKDHLFARKFDIKMDEEILNLLDIHVINKVQ